MNEYTPDTSQVKGCYILFSRENDKKYHNHNKEKTKKIREFYYEFDRWYDEEIRKAKAEAWLEGVQSGESDEPALSLRLDNPYR